MKIFKYQKVTNKFTTYTIVEPDYQEEDDRITELSVIDGITYISVPDTITLPKQPEIIKKTLEGVILSNELKEDIKSNSSHVQLINQRVKEKILSDISITDELKLLRDELNRVKAELHISANIEYDTLNDRVMAYRTWGEKEKSKLGL